jgi:cytochrome c556
MRKTSLMIHALTAMTVLMGGITMSTAGQAADDPVKVRREGFEANKKSMGVIKKALEDNGPLTEVKAQVEAMNAFSKQIATLFPPGSDKGKTEAKTEIWQNFPDFTAKAQKFEAESAKLAEITDAGDKAAVMKQFGAVGATCKGCHELYRQD